MHIYSDTDLYNKHVQEEASAAYLNKKLGDESFKKILSAYSSSLYTPNYFIRIALGVLTMVAIIFSALLVLFMFLSKGRGVVQCFTLAAIYYAGLELFVRDKHYYNAGIDNLLMFFSLTFLLGGFVVYEYAGHHILISFIAMLACLYLSIRFVDSFMAVLSFLALLVFIFLVYTGLGTFAKATAPFLLMTVSAVVYFTLKKLLNENYLFYPRTFKAVLQVSFLAFYAAANYFVITELTYKMFPYQFSQNYPIPLGWLFWILTFVIPVAYIAYGIAKKDLMFIRTGMVLVALSIFTFRHYYHVVPVETAMLAAGGLATVVSYILINYLKTPKGGYSFEKQAAAKERIDMKSLIIAQVSGKNAEVPKGVELGGGSFGSGGAGGTY